MSGYNSPVDEPPGKDGTQGRPPDEELPPLPVWEPGENPVGTHPPVDPPVDPATVPVPGSVPGGFAEADPDPVEPPAEPEATEEEPF